MKITATSNTSFNEIHRETTYYGNYWAAIRLVGWISQNKTNKETTLYFKWQKGADNYWPWNYNYYSFSVKLGSTTVSDSLQMPQATNDWVDISSTKSIKVKHGENGKYSGTLEITGYKYIESYFSTTVAIEFPDISTTKPADQKDQEAEQAESHIEPAPVTSDPYDIRYYILCDGQIVYSPNDDAHLVTSPELKISVKDTDSLSFVIAPGNDMYDRITKLRSNIEVRQGKDILFRGRVIDDSTDFNNQKSVNCEGARAFFNDTVFPPFAKGEYKTAKAFFKAVVDQHNSQAKDDRELVFVRCNINQGIEVENDEYQTCSEALSELAEQVEGYFKLDYYENGKTGISFLSSYGHTSSQQIELQKNLLDVTIRVDATTIYTSVLPLGEKKDVYFQTSDTKKDPDKTYYVKETEKHKDYDDSTKPGYHKTREAYKEFTEDTFVAGTTYYEKGLSKRLRISELESENYGYIEDQAAINKFGRIVKVVTFDDVKDMDEDTWAPINYKEKLKELGEVYLQAGLGADVTIEGRLVDYHMVDPNEEKLHVGDSVKIISTPHGLDGYYMLSECDIPMQSPDQANYTFGATIRALTDI